jgi:broad specificity phosphatase PhoE
MKHVYILRHAQKDKAGNLTEEGKIKAEELQYKLPKFKLIIASDSPRTQETAILLTKIKPIIDSRAGYFNAPKEVSEEISIQSKSNKAGFTGAYLQNEAIREEVIAKAEGLIELIFETLEKLEPNENALIISHDITMVPAEKLLTKNFNTQSFNYLSGYVVDENRQLYPYSQ